MDQARRVLLLRWLALGLLSLAVVLQLKLWTSDSGRRGVRELEARVAAQRIENATLEQRNAALAADVADLKAGGDAVEERARSELGMVRPDEVFYQVVREAPAGAATPSTTPATPEAP